MRGKTKLPTSEISRAYRCPICNKTKMFVSKFGKDRGKLKKCQNCGYINKTSLS
jgi:predicted RNA-binding Zn-ribbon protein involved in translation (DUF1610 family)